MSDTLVLMVRSAVAATTCIYIVLMWGCNDDADRDGFTAADWDVLHTLSPLPDVDYDAAAAELGQRLFFDKRLSGPIVVGDDGQNGGLGAPGESGDVACASCHMPFLSSDPDDRDFGEPAWFVDRRSRPNATSLGTAWTDRNTPTIVNAIYHASFPWHGKFPTIAELMRGPLTGEAFMNSSEDRIAQVLRDHYQLEYDSLFPNTPIGSYDDTDAEKQAILLDNVGRVLEAYQRRIISRNAPFDQYVAGDFAAISERAKRGLGLFIGDALCIECHSGPNFSDEDFHHTGIPQYGEHVPPEDLGEFRTPSLRTVAETAPYMHAGQLETLTDVVNFYWRGCDSDLVDHPAITPLDDLTAGDMLDLVAFLEALTGEPIPDELAEHASSP